MAEGTPSGWLPPTAPGAGPRPRFDGPAEPAVAPQPAEPQPGRPAFARPEPAVRVVRSRSAAWGLALGIAGLILLVLSFGSLFMIALPCSAGGYALARRARDELEQAGSQNDGQAVAALWVARIGVIAGVAAAVVFIALIASGFDFEQFRDDLQRELDQRRQEQDGGDSGNVRTSIEHLRLAWASWPAR